MGQQVAFYVQSLSDIVISVDGTSIPGTVASALPSYDSTFFIDNYWDQDGPGEEVLSRTITTSSSTLILIDSNNQQYTCNSEAFIGGHPVRRPH